MSSGQLILELKDKVGRAQLLGLELEEDHGVGQRFSFNHPQDRHTPVT